MAIVWVQRVSGPGSAVQAVFQNQQPGLADESIDSSDATVQTFLRGRVKRSLLAIHADLVALTAAQKTNVWNAFIAGTPALWSTDTGPNAAALAALQMLGASATLPAADVLEAKVRSVMVYVQDNPGFLINPSFDPSINIAGDVPG